jgi:mannose-1-phosphate guanylyltransferase
MAGGAGTRLWPISRKLKPKQIYPLIDHETLLQKTWKRLRRGFPAKNIYLATGKNLVREVKKQLPQLIFRNISVEPVRRDTAAGLGLALLKIHKRDPRGIFVYINADNFVRDEKEFLRMLKVAERMVKLKPNHAVLIGVNPSYPETGYGYIKMGSQVMKFSTKGGFASGGERKNKNIKIQERKNKADEVFEVEEFVEKPNLETAKKYLASWEHLWNPTLIVARVDHFLSLYKKHLPQMWRVLLKISHAVDSKDESRVTGKEFPKIRPISVDYGLLEREKKMLVLPADFGWSDVGHWRAIREILAENQKSKIKNQKLNLCKGSKCVLIDSNKNLIYSMTGRLVAGVGLHDMIIIETDDALLVCPKDKAQDVKKIVAELEKRNLKGYL